ncbi:MAG: hypothetical protein KME11_22665 [Timaviella obliquedivisa GSE-PSE-MK23-08B]|jgi:hypothetical protein|nr:hypothetical protein [Timaviella obliquedivisa GSE-PSE-MK23-08B]
MFGFEFYLLMGVIAVVVFWTAAATGFKWFQQYRLKRSRKGQNRQSFVRYFIVEGIPEAIAIEVYRYLQKLQLVKNFPVSPEDNIEQVYGLQDEDLTEAIVAIAQICRVPIPPENSPLWSQAHVFSVEDLIRFIDFLRQSNSG